MLADISRRDGAGRSACAAVVVAAGMWSDWHMAQSTAAVEGPQRSDGTADPRLWPFGARAAILAVPLIAAGLLSHAVHELVEVGVIAIGTEIAFDLSGILPHSGEGFLALVGSLLRAMFGYTSQPEWVTFLTWLGYIVVVLPLYLRPLRPAESASRPVEQTTAKA
jgi:hypothetical protein